MRTSTPNCSSECRATLDSGSGKVGKMRGADCTIGEQEGFLKALIAGNGEQILGFTMIGPEAGEVMPVVQTAMLARLPYTVLRDAVIAHPTMTEGLGSLLSKVPETPFAAGR